MSKHPDPLQPRPARGRRHKRHQIELANGGRLVLAGDGSIRQVDDTGATTDAWTTDDSGWPGQAIRFGLHPRPLTVAPQGHQVQATKNKRW